MLIFINVESVVKAKLLGDTLEIKNEKICFINQEDNYGAGLIRDERMWATDEEIKILRILFLGLECMDNDIYQEYVNKYKKIHGDKYSSIFTTGVGNLCVIRTMCMPLNKVLPDDFDILSFAKKMSLNIDKTIEKFNKLKGEKEIFHGCRGIRFFLINNDFLNLWIETILIALKRAIVAGANIRIRFLLATLSISEEAELFLECLKKISTKIFINENYIPVDGVSIMLETSSAYIDLESILSQKNERFIINGGMIGSNDFTAACLNMNRHDAPKYLIPEYVKIGLFKKSPFNEIYTPVVGKALLKAMCINLLKTINKVSIFASKIYQMS